MAYKQEPNYKIKKEKLVKLDEKRKGIKMLMQECERLMTDRVVLYCQMATMHSGELRITDDYHTYNNIEYALIYAN